MSRKKIPPTNMNAAAEYIRRVAIEHGWENTTRSFGEEVALWHSECSEALEEHRVGRAQDEIYYSTSCSVCHQPKTHIIHFTDYEGETTHRYNEELKPEGIPIEAVDVLIRICHWAAREGIDLDDAFHIKAAYNVTRPFRHGNKVL